ncbi:helix-turn-helix domain-containing protein [Actinokineospora enzanensis]|uniref:helix-turn-helix domain-containing protein n=1 Tax=Actinokineospora enzanensis TaxID=155975 RepID=UPI0012EB474A
MTRSSAWPTESNPISSRLAIGLIGLIVSTNGVATRINQEWIGIQPTSGFWVPSNAPSNSLTVRSTIHSPSPGQETSSAALIKKIHSDSGLTWEQLAKIFGVSRRALHHWTNGGRLNAANLQKLHELSMTVGQLEGGPENRRTHLLMPGDQAKSIYDLLRADNSSSETDINRPIHL